MPPRAKEFNGVVLILDIGLTAKSSGFLQSSVLCAEELLQRKLFSESPDKFGIVLLGAEKTDNALDYENISVVKDNLSQVNWEMMEFVRNHVQGTDKQSDWLDGVVVAMNLLKESTENDKKCIGKKIVLISDLSTQTNDSNLEVIMANLKKENIEFMFFGPKWKEDDEDNDQPSTSRQADERDNQFHSKPKSKQQIENEAIIKRIISDTEGVLCNINEAIVNFQFKERRSKKPNPWIGTLQIGPDIKIKSKAFILVRREAPKSWKKCWSRSNNDNEITELKPEVTFVKNTEDQEVIHDYDNIIQSYKYGTQLITVNDEEKAFHQYEAGPRDLSVIGFIPQTEIPRHLVLGDGCMVFQPVENDPHALIALSSLAHALFEMGQVALVRRVYRMNSTPRIGVIIPEYVDNEEGGSELILTYVELPYSEDIREYIFAPVYNDQVKPNDTQLEAVDNLIDSMMLSNENEDELQTDQLMNPIYQYLYRCINHRALFPGHILPEVSDNIRRLTQAPQSIDSSASSIIEKISEVFKLEEIETKKTKTTGQNLFNDKKRQTEKSDDEDDEEPDKKKSKLNDFEISMADQIVSEVGTTNPVDDFHNLLEHNQPFTFVVQQLEGVILKLIRSSFGTQLAEKILKCLRAYRQSCIERSHPNLYNDFMNEIKFTLESMKLSSLMEDIVSNELSLITKEEHYDSKVTEEEAKKFYSAESESSTKEDTKEEANEEDNDLLDEL